MSGIVIDEKRCKACYLCISECSRHLIKISDKTNEMGNKVAVFQDNNKECWGCAKCATRCPEVAICKVVRD